MKLRSMLKVGREWDVHVPICCRTFTADYDWLEISCPSRDLNQKFDKDLGGDGKWVMDYKAPKAAANKKD